ncbi:hypothetical protein SAMN05880582_101803 [Rhizobium sp. RU20A]|uniref:DUF2188 domain-containing protein n=1 Tax=Rhizobium sp. RU20A TaxID=1907412 RepID=UPI0009554FD4|nr:DUF2188 domain-containing protein [Rhizobium sp. RU20A]SIQ11805.1 hypothetical protein SAMN05880582_101803 [Rhizobium sp. RU20A]
MTVIRYSIVEHDGGWAYQLDGAYSESFPTHKAALRAAKIAAIEQQVGGEDAEIVYQDADGNWHTEHADGGDRPQAEVVDG